MESVKIKKTLSDEEIENKIKKIREKTFNSSLRNLVNKITDEKRVNDSKEENEKKASTSESILKRMHSLFYKTINLADYQSINTNFNPFSLKKSISKDSLANSIKKQLKKIGIEEYSFLFYSHKLKSFASEVSTFYTFNKDNLVISISESIFKKIFNTSKGIIIERTYFTGNLMQQKRSGEVKKNNSNLYCISLKNLSPLLWQKFVKLPNVINEKIFSPILILSYDIEGHVKKEVFFEKLQKKVSILFYLYFSLVNRENRDISMYPVQSVYSYMHLYEDDKDICPISLKNIGDFDNEVFVLMKYIHGKLKSLASSKTSIHYFDRNTIMIFSHADDLPFIKKYIKDLQKLYINKFTVTEHTSHFS